MAGTEVLNVEAELQKQALAIAGRVAAPSGNRIRVTLAKTFKLPDGTETQGPLECVLVEFSAANYYYTSAYTDDNITPPECFALGFDANTLAPSVNSPKKQAENCTVCPQNQFKTAANGSGKACRNTRQVAVLPMGATEDSPIWLLGVSPTALQFFDKYVTAVTRKVGHPMKVITKIGFDPSSRYASLRFMADRPNDNVELAFKRQEEARQLLMVEPDVTSLQVDAAAGGNKAKPLIRRK